MGSELISFYQNKVKKNWKIAFLSAFIMGLLVHMYKFTNNFPYFDSYYNSYSSQDMIQLGRWFLSIACGFSSYFDLPWMIGVMSVLFMAFTAVIVAEVLEIENPCLVILSSGLLVSFPAITETMFFEFTADGYMVAMFLSALAVYFSRIEYCGSRKHLLLSVVCLCFACGIYQSYISFAFILAICYFIYQLLENRYERSVYLKWVLYQAAIYILGLLSYYAVWQILMKARGIAAEAYQGISAMGQSPVETIVQAFYNSIVSFVAFLLERNPLHQGFTAYSLLNCLSCLTFAGVCCVAFVKSGILKRKTELFLILLCLCVIPFGCYICYFISPGITYYTRMLEPIVLLFVFTGVLCERWLWPKCKNLVLILLFSVMLNNSVMANVCYTYMNNSYEKAYASLVEISTRIHMEDDGTAKQILFVGTFDPVEEDADIDNAQLGTLGPLKLVSKAQVFYHDHMMLFMDQYTDFTLSYYRINGEEFPVVPHNTGSTVTSDFEFRFPTLEIADAMALQYSDEVTQMGIWPGKDSVKKIGETIVVKLSEPEQ